jgi:hypothetical protein
MVRYKICFNCNYTGSSKISPRDNTTKICSLCAEFEAVSEFLSQNIQKPAEPVLQTIYRLLAPSLRASQLTGDDPSPRRRQNHRRRPRFR